MSAENRLDKDRLRHLMMAELDGELSASERRELDRGLEQQPELREERGRLSRVKEVTKTMKLTSPPDEIWDGYWHSVYNRVERGLGWLLFSAGLIVLLVWGSWQAVDAIVADQELPPLIKLAIFGVLGGGLVLLYSVAREKWFTHRRDPYREVER